MPTGYVTSAFEIAESNSNNMCDLPTNIMEIQVCEEMGEGAVKSPRSVPTPA